jgi:hypothetical protein
MAIKIESKVFWAKSSSAQHPSAEAIVDPEYTLTGGGAWVDYAEPGNLLFESYPTRSNGDVWTGWKAHAKDSWWASFATITTYAIGIKVTKDGQPVSLDHAVFKAIGRKATFPVGKSGWCGTGGGVECQQNDFENVFISETAPPRDGSDEAGYNDISSWFGTHQYCSSPTSIGKPTGGGSITTYLIAIRAEGIRFRTKLHYRNSEQAQHPSTEVSANGEVVVSGGAIDNFTEEGLSNSVNMLTASYPAFEDADHITGWKVAGKDQHFPSPSVIRACVVTLSAEESA